MLSWANHSFIHLLTQNPLTDYMRQYVGAIGTWRWMRNIICPPGVSKLHFHIDQNENISFYLRLTDYWQTEINQHISELSTDTMGARRPKEIPLFLEHPSPETLVKHRLGAQSSAKQCGISPRAWHRTRKWVLTIHGIQVDVWQPWRVLPGDDPCQRMWAEWF